MPQTFFKPEKPEDRELFIRIFELIANAEKCKNGIAVIINHAKITYGELNAKADQLAKYLLKNIPEKTCVGVYLYPSIEWVIVFLALRKAGMVYVPLSAEAEVVEEIKIQRLKKICEITKLAHIITDSSLKDHFFIKNIAISIIVYSRDQKLILDNANLNLPKIKPEWSAYIVFSSGTTGEPKGIEITEAGLPAAMESHHKILKMTDEKSSVVTQSMSIGFDASIVELMTALGIGSILYIVPHEKRANPEELAEYYAGKIIENRSVILINTPTMLTEITRTKLWQESPARFANISYVLGMGEAFRRRIGKAVLSQSS